MLLFVGLTGCTLAQEVDLSVRVVDLPGAAEGIDFDDVVYSADWKQVVVPARESGIYLLAPDTGEAKRVPYSGNVDSADAGDGLLFGLDRGAHRIDVLDPGDGRLISSAAVAAPSDYIRYVPATRELWVTEPAKEGIEIFALGKSLGEAPRRSGFISVPGGVEGLTLTSNGAAAYTHAGDDVARIDAKARTVAARWPTGCDGTHGFPRIDERGGFLLASCADNGKVTLLDLKDGGRLGDYELGEGESLPAYSSGPGHFYVRSDPGTTIATLAASARGLELVRKVKVPETGHCLGADDTGRYWTCDARSGRVLLFQDR
ncbi:YncE family protein [Arthrobacter sp. GCM10027362]|uniref:YncE family protein n=1 Tax=Arthrobacter sp. GCM10027362 TaxID=3273379 RepID=UPI0036435A04